MADRLPPLGILRGLLLDEGVPLRYLAAAERAVRKWLRLRGEAG